MAENLLVIAAVYPPVGPHPHPLAGASLNRINPRRRQPLLSNQVFAAAVQGGPTLRNARGIGVAKPSKEVADESGSRAAVSACFLWF